MIIEKSKYELKWKYEITEEGQVLSEKYKRPLSIQYDKDGYQKVQMISMDGKRHRYSVHRLVLENFNPVEDMEKLHVNHIDGNKSNNKLENLEWVTSSENNKHAHKIGLKNQSGASNNATRLTEENVKDIVQLLLEKNLTQKQIGEKFGVGADTVGAIKRKQNWKYLTENITF